MNKRATDNRGGDNMVNRVCVFCGSNAGFNGNYLEDARLLADALADAGLGLVYGGGGTGLMRALAEAVRTRGGEVIGVVPDAFINTENVFETLSEKYVVGSYHERKMLMYHLADAFIALPGGPGTLEELLEHLTWLRRSAVIKPVYLINVDGYWNSLLKLFDDMRAAGFIFDNLTDRCRVFTSSSLAIRDLLECAEKAEPAVAPQDGSYPSQYSSKDGAYKAASRPRPGSKDA